MSPCRLRNAPLMARGEEEEEKRVNSAADIADITGGTGGEKDSPPAGRGDSARAIGGPASGRVREHVRPEAARVRRGRIAQQRQPEQLLERSQRREVVVGVGRDRPGRINGDSATAPTRPPPRPGVGPPLFGVFGNCAWLQQALASAVAPSASASSKVISSSPSRLNAVRAE